MNAGVIGAGTMGVGIAHAFAISGVAVTLSDPDKAALARARTSFDGVVASGVSRGKVTEEDAQRAVASIDYVTEIDGIPFGAEIIIETVPERLDLKLSVLRTIEARTPQIIGSNTSSLSISALAEALEQPTKFLGFHFFNPVWSKSLVELVVGGSTSPSTVETAIQIAATIGKDTIVVKDSPGFATSRLGIILGLEAIRLLESGIASADDIDTAMTRGYGHPMGPLRLTDLVGLDVRLDIAQYLESVYGPRFSPPELLVNMVRDGKLGKKVGHGFFTW